MTPQHCAVTLLPYHSKKQGPFYEVWYVIFVDPSNKESYWIRFLVLRTKKNPEMLIPRVYFSRVSLINPERNTTLVQTFNPNSFSMNVDPFFLNIKDCSLTKDKMKGSIEDRGRAICFDLKLTPSCFNHTYLSKFLSLMTSGRSMVSIPYPSLLVDGTITIDGEKLEVKSATGHLAHHFGKKQIYGWDWLHALGFKDYPETILEILSPKISPYLPQLTLINLYHEDRWYNSSSLIRGLLNKTQNGLCCWYFKSHGTGIKIEAHVRAPLESMVIFPYESPQGAFSYCINSQQADCVLEIKPKKPSSKPLRLISNGTTSVESNLCEKEKNTSFFYLNAGDTFTDLKKSLTKNP